MTLLSVRKCFMFTKQWSIAWMWIRVIVTDLYCVYIDCIVCTLTILCVHWLYCVYIDCRYFIVFFILQNRKNKPHKFTLNIFIWFYYIININKRQRTKLFQKKFLVILYRVIFHWSKLTGCCWNCYWYYISLIIPYFRFYNIGEFV